MTPLFDMLTQANGGQIAEQIARQYGISTQQAQSAMAALMPAFSQGVKRNVADPANFMNLMQAMASGQQANTMDAPQNAFTAPGIEAGNAILGQLFGSKDLSRAVAAQASQATGLSQSIMKSLLPALAPMVLGGLFKQMMGGQMAGLGNSPANSASAGFPGGANNPLGQIFEQMMGGGQSSQNRAPQGGSATDNPFGKMMEEMMGGGRRAQPQSPGGSDNPLGDLLGQIFGGGAGGQTSQAPSAGDNPLGKMFEEMLGGRAPSASEDPYSEPRREREHEPERQTQQPRKETQPGSLEDILGKMFETGKTTQKEYNRNVESIFDEFLGGMQKGR